MTADFEKHKQAIERDPNRVRCAHCGAWVPARAEKCRSCGVHFKGEAFQFSHASDEIEGARRARATRIRRMAIVIGILFLVAVVAYFTR